MQTQLKRRLGLVLAGLMLAGSAVPTLAHQESLFEPVHRHWGEREAYLRAADIWVPGHFGFVDGERVWVPGHWRRHHVQGRWIPAHYERFGYRVVFVPGHWEHW